MIQQKLENILGKKPVQKKSITFLCCIVNIMKAYLCALRIELFIIPEMSSCSANLLALTVFDNACVVVIKAYFMFIDDKQ